MGLLVVVVEDSLKGYGGGIGQAVDEPVDRDPYVLSLSANEALCADDVLRDRPVVVVDSGEQLRDLERVGPTASTSPSKRRVTTVRPKRMPNLKLSRGEAPRDTRRTLTGLVEVSGDERGWRDSRRC